MVEFTEYREIRNYVKTGDLYFTHSKDLISRLIRLITQSKVSHVGIFFWIGERLFIGEELQGKGCRMMLASERFVMDSLLLVRPKVDNDQVVDRILHDIGRLPYNWIGVVLAPFIRLKIYQKDCAEWVCKILHVKINTGRGIYPSDVLRYFLTQ